MGLFSKNKAVFAELHNLTAALDPKELKSMTASFSGGLKGLTGSVDPDLLKNGLLGQGMITSVKETGTIVGNHMDPRPVCDFGVEVRLDDTPPYAAQFRQSVRLIDLPQFVPGETLIAVRVDPNNQAHVAMDRSVEPPSVRIGTPAGAPSAAGVLQTGDPVRAVIIQSQPLNATSPVGLPLYAFVITVLQDGHPPRQAQLGLAVPADAIPLLYPGSNLPAKTQHDRPELVAIDWVAAVEEASK